MQRSNQLVTTLIPTHIGKNIFLGITLGFALIGFVQVLKSLLPKTRKLGLPVLEGIASPPLVPVFALLLVAFTEELWRALCLNSLKADGDIDCIHLDVFGSGHFHCNFRRDCRRSFCSAFLVEWFFPHAVYCAPGCSNTSLALCVGRCAGWRARSNES